MGMYWILLVEAVHQHAKNGKLTDKLGEFAIEDVIGLGGPFLLATFPRRVTTNLNKNSLLSTETSRAIKNQSYGRKTPLN